MSINTGFRYEKLSGALVYYQFAAFLFIFSEKKERTFNAGKEKRGINCVKVYLGMKAHEKHCVLA